MDYAYFLCLDYFSTFLSTLSLAQWKHSYIICSYYLLTYMHSDKKPGGVTSRPSIVHSHPLNYLLVQPTMLPTHDARVRPPACYLNRALTNQLPNHHFLYALWSACSSVATNNHLDLYLGSSTPMSSCTFAKDSRTTNSHFTFLLAHFLDLMIEALPNIA